MVNLPTTFPLSLPSPRRTILHHTLQKKNTITFFIPSMTIAFALPHGTIALYKPLQDEKIHE